MKKTEAIVLLARENVRALTPYQSARKIGGEGTIWLNANESAHAPDFAPQGMNRYPSPQPQAVVAAYAQYAGVLPENVLVTRGGDEGIELLMRAFCEPAVADYAGEAILYCPPTYGMYAVSAQTLGVRQIVVAQRADFSLDLAEIERCLQEDAGIKVVFVCHPNNPTGALISDEQLQALLALTAGRCVLVIDEAYIEFSAQASWVKKIADYPHLAIIRTLSKAFALAGLRCGFVLADAALIALLAKVIAPYPIPTPVAEMATTALSAENVQGMWARVQEVLALREQLIQGLLQLSFVKEVFDSAGNFVLFRCKEGQLVFEALWQEGAILRNQHVALGLNNCIRMTVGSQAENEAVLAMLARLEKRFT